MWSWNNNLAAWWLLTGEWQMFIISGISVELQHCNSNVNVCTTFCLLIVLGRLKCGSDSELTFPSCNSDTPRRKEQLDLSDNFSNSLSRTNKTLEVVENLSGRMRQWGSETMLNVPCIYWISHIMEVGGYVVQMMEVSSLEDFYYYRTKVSHLSRL